MNWLILSQEDQLKLLHEQSFLPSINIIIFKHSPRCSISNMAKDRLERKWSLDANLFPVYCIDVLQSRPISLEIADIYKVEHQSPQLLVIKNGKCVFSASHSGISFEDLNAFLSQ